MSKLIINADDFGLTDGCNKGIIKAIQNGVVSSTTVMINMPYSYEGIELLKKINFKSVGIHLTLTCGKPTLPQEEVQTLVDENNNFYRRKENLFPHMKLEEVEKELRNQIELFFKTGLIPSHIDSHHHIHKYEGIRQVVVKLAKEYKLPLRHVDDDTKTYIQEKNIITTDGFSMDFYNEKANLKTIKEILTKFDGDTLEIMVHPAIVDNELKNKSSYNEIRYKELEILTSHDIKDWISENRIELIGYNDLQ